MPGITDPNEEFFKNGLWGWVTNTWKKLIADTAGHLQVDVVASDLPTGAATATNQTTINANISTLVKPAATHNIYNVTMTSANTEYSQTLPASTKKFTIKCRTNYDVKLCFTSGASGTTYITIPAGMTYWDDLIKPVTLTLYFQCPTAAQVTEIVAWS